MISRHRFLRGDYCLKSDLRERPEQPHKLFEAKISKVLLDTLFDYLTTDADMSDPSLTDGDEKLLRSYVTENADSVSFAGRIVNKIANLSQKLAIFENETSEHKPNVLSDDELRLISMTKKEMKHLRKRSVSITLPSAKLPRGLIQRRPTGFVHADDIPFLVGEIEQEQETEDEENIPHSFSLDSISTSRSESILSNISQKTCDEPVRKVTIAQNKNTSSKQGDNEQGLPKISVLTRLYDDVRINKEDMVLPTLKSYKPFAATNSNNYLLTETSFFLNDDETRDKYYSHNIQSEDYSLDYVLHLQCGKKFTRKISSDYVRTIDHIEHQPQNSLRSVENFIVISVIYVLILTLIIRFLLELEVCRRLQKKYTCIDLEKKTVQNSNISLSFVY
ncbi:unnamed protein product [Arctia plantaginis]|uniref:Uncharacterized protein n=1 Tax=Arctia plantaginis TaxID=874455 RepID=A0A8S1BSN6_ARCPL|nr:unnamed protein product [Arctia plantaginis]